MRAARTSLPLAVVALLTVAAPAQAQFGVRGGVNLTDLVGDDAGETERRRGLSLGAYVDVFRVGPVDVAAEVYYRQKGADLTSLQAELAQGQAPPETLEFGLDYVEIPVLLRWNVVQGSRARLYLAGGPAFAWRLDCGIEVSSGTGDSSPDCDDLLGDDAEETLRDYEQGLVVSGGIDLLVLRNMGALNLDARYTKGLSRVSGNREWKNEAFSLMLGWEFSPRWR